jgi:hypothetical protein
MENANREKNFCKDCVYFTRNVSPKKLLDYSESGYCAYYLKLVRRDPQQSACQFYEPRENKNEVPNEIQKAIFDINKKLDEILRILKT